MMPQEARVGQGTGLSSAEPFDSAPLGGIHLDCAERTASEILSRTQSVSASLLGSVWVRSRIAGEVGQAAAPAHMTKDIGGTRAL